MFPLPRHQGLVPRRWLESSSAQTLETPPSSASEVFRPEAMGWEGDSRPPPPHQLSPTIGCASASHTTVGDSLVNPPRFPPPTQAVDSGSLGGTRPCTNTGENLPAVCQLFLVQRLRESRVSYLPPAPCQSFRRAAGCDPLVPQRRSPPRDRPSLQCDQAPVTMTPRYGRLVSHLPPPPRAPPHLPKRTPGCAAFSQITDSPVPGARRIA